MSLYLAHGRVLIGDTFQIELEFRDVGFWGERKTVVPGEKTSRSKDENEQKTRTTYDAESGNRTRATLVGGECSHDCAIPAFRYIAKVWGDLSLKRILVSVRNLIRISEAVYSTKTNSIGWNLTKEYNETLELKRLTLNIVIAQYL